MSNKSVKVLVVNLNEEPVVVEVANHFKAFQKIVSGLFTFMPFDSSNPDCELMVNDEYLVNGSTFNRFIQSDYHTFENGGALEYGVPIMGAFAVMRRDFTTGEAVSLTDEDIEKYTKEFGLALAYERYHSTRSKLLMAQSGGDTNEQTESLGVGRVYVVLV